MICIGLVLIWCQLPTQQAIDSYCQVYQPVVVRKGDGSIAAPLAVKQRILANELTYRKLCR